MKYILIAIIIMVTASCTKHAGDIIETGVPIAQLVLSAPVAGQVFKAGDSISIAGVATCTAVMHGYDAYLTFPGDTSRLQTMSIHDHNDTLIIDKKFAPRIAGDYAAHILIYLDHDGHTYHQAVRFSVQ